MPGRRTRDLEIATLRFMFGRVSLDPPPTWYLVLCTTAPTETVLGTPVSDAAQRYSRRKAIPNSAGSWTVPDPDQRGETRNVWRITYQTAKEDILDVGWAELWNAKTEGERFYWGTFVNDAGTAVKFSVPVGTRLRITAQGIVSRED